MKRMLTILLAVAILAALTACGGNEPPASSAPAQATTTTTTTVAETDAVTTTSGTPISIATLKGQTSTTFKGYTTKATTTTAATTASSLKPVLDKPYVCQITAGTDLIVATVTFSEEVCIIDRTFYTCNTEHKVYGTDVPTLKVGSQTYYKSGYAAQPAALYEISGYTINVFNADGSTAKSFVMGSPTTLGCSKSDGVAFGRNNNFTLQD